MRRRLLYQLKMKKADSAENSVKSKSWKKIFKNLRKNSHMIFAYKGLKSGEGFVTYEVCSGQRKHRSINRESSGLAQQNITSESRRS